MYIKGLRHEICTEVNKIIQHVFESLSGEACRDDSLILMALFSNSGAAEMVERNWWRLIYK